MSGNRCLLQAGLTALVLLMALTAAGRNPAPLTTSQPVLVDLAVIDEHADDPFHSVLIR